MKFLAKHIDQDALKASLAFAVIYCLMFNSSVFVYKSINYNIGAVELVFMIIKDFLLTTGALFVFFFGATMHSILFRVFAVLLFLGGAIASYHMYVYEATMSARLMRSLYGNSPMEAYSLVSIKLVIWMIFSLGICYSAIWHFKVRTPSQFFTKLLCAVCLFLFVNCIISPPFPFLEDYFPTQFLSSIYF